MLFELRRRGALLLYLFRHRDPRTGKWVSARYKAERDVIAERYAEWEITGPAEVHRRGGGGDSFNPSSKLAPRGHLPIEEPPDERPPPEKPSLSRKRMISGRAEFSRPKKKRERQPPRRPFLSLRPAMPHLLCGRSPAPRDSNEADQT
jgi:hypothetical protein